MPVVLPENEPAFQRIATSRPQVEGIGHPSVNLDAPTERENPQQTAKAQVQPAAGKVCKFSRSSVTDSNERWKIVSTILGAAHPPSHRMLSFASQSSSLSAAHGSEGPPPRSTVGFRLQGNIIEEILPWGPAHLSEQVMVGDSILEVDGHPVTADTAANAVIGADEYNTYVTLKLEKADGSGIHAVRLVRVFRPLTRIAEDLFGTLVKLRNSLSSSVPASKNQLDSVLDAVSALQIGNFDDRQAFMDKLFCPSSHTV